MKTKPLKVDVSFGEALHKIANTPTSVITNKHIEDKADKSNEKKKVGNKDEVK